VSGPLLDRRDALTAIGGLVAVAFPWKPKPKWRRYGDGLFGSGTYGGRT
jgi:hypothetical protein